MKNSPLYEQPKAHTEESVRSSRRTLAMFGIGFIVAGSWAIYIDLPLGKSTGALFRILLPFIEAQNRATVLYVSSIILGIFLLIGYLLSIRTKVASEKKLETDSE